jgi:hypothetical protein
MALQLVKIGSLKDKATIKKWRALQKVKSDADKLFSLIEKRKNVLLDRFHNPKTKEEKDNYLGLDVYLLGIDRYRGGGYSDNENLIDNTSYPDNVKSEAKDIVKLMYRYVSMVEERDKLSSEYNDMVENVEYTR